jgi:hypothetical protein
MTQRKINHLIVERPARSRGGFKTRPYNVADWFLLFPFSVQQFYDFENCFQSKKNKSLRSLRLCGEYSGKIICLKL